MKNCGGRFHNEVGKFRFLNELIKVVSPKVSPIVQFSFIISSGKQHSMGFNFFLNKIAGCREKQRAVCMKKLRLSFSFQKILKS